MDADTLHQATTTATASTREKWEIEGQPEPEDDHRDKRTRVELMEFYFAKVQSLQQQKQSKEI